MTSPFATPTAHVHAAFDHVMQGVRGLTPEQLAALKTAYTEAHQAGDPRAEIRAFRAAGAEAPVKWPAFDAWLERFDREGLFPHLWRPIARICASAAHEGEAPAAADLQGSMLELLAHTVSSTAFACRDHDRNGRFISSRGWRLSGAGDVVEDALAAEHLAGVRLDDWRTWPPFFPGCRTSLMAR